jgi:hypothetical protein
VLGGNLAGLPDGHGAVLCDRKLLGLDYAKEKNTEGVTEYSDRADRLMLDNIINFFALLARRVSSKEVIKHCDFAYDWCGARSYGISRCFSKSIMSIT